MFNNYKEQKMNPIWVVVVVLSSFLTAMWRYSRPLKPASDYLEMNEERRRLILQAARMERDEKLEEHC